MQSRDAIPSCSKAARGLIVLPRVARILTGIAISPGGLPRQRSSRCAIRAGRNLPDKEFRYLRTVRVTAAVHRGFSFGLAPVSLTFRHWAGVSPYTSPYGFAGTCVFVKQSLEPVHCDPFGLRRACRHHPTGAPLLPKLRGEIAEFLSRPCPDPLPAFTGAHQCRFAVRTPAQLATRLFLPGRLNRVARGCPWTSHRVSSLVPWICLRHRPTRLDAHSHKRAQSTVPGPLFAHDAEQVVREYQPVVLRLRLSASA